ncbi:hypothetical protein RchiOBHm_Chr1g0313751 [Rosa chinensis]|uniref:Uncharacterized protein n=1 Tax=Rosa chinensis TaxID=74649 RepID=A0A2P6S711_ROSCH|nr:hypothetical protein RchiOBHm_Chr1g0313751 [Rosa chinensis]
MEELYAAVILFGRPWFFMPKIVNASLMLIKTRIWQGHSRRKEVLDQFDDLLNADNIIFKNARCKVLLVITF